MFEVGKEKVRVEVRFVRGADRSVGLAGAKAESQVGRGIV